MLRCLDCSLHFLPASGVEVHRLPEAPAPAPPC
jgi:hypothetical protein